VTEGEFGIVLRCSCSCQEMMSFAKGIEELTLVPSSSMTPASPISYEDEEAAIFCTFSLISQGNIIVRSHVGPYIPIPSGR
jgi:hypothetical protein